MKRWFGRIFVGGLVTLTLLCAIWWLRGQSVMDRIAFSLGGRLVTISTIPAPGESVTLTVIGDWPIDERLRWQSAREDPALYWLHSATGARTQWEWAGASVSWSYVATALYDGLPRERALPAPSTAFVTPDEPPDGESAPLPLMQVVAPFWMLAVLFGVLPLVLLARRIDRARVRQRRLRQGLCVQCGYDLRESPERCPECGATAGQLA